MWDFTFAKRLEKHFVRDKPATSPVVLFHPGPSGDRSSRSVRSVSDPKPEPHGGLRGFRRPSIPGCYVTKFARRKPRNLIAWCKLTFDERVVVHRVDSGARESYRTPARIHEDLICKGFQN